MHVHPRKDDLGATLLSCISSCVISASVIEFSIETAPMQRLTYRFIGKI
jgi:hypothetical protein